MQLFADAIVAMLTSGGVRWSFLDGRHTLTTLGVPLVQPLCVQPQARQDGSARSHDHTTPATSQRNGNPNPNHSKTTPFTG